MKKSLLFVLLCCSIFMAQAQYKNKELAFNLKDGRSLFIAENSNDKVGVIDNNDNIIIPFDYFAAMKVHNDKNAFFIVYPQMGSSMEIYNVEGVKIIDSSEGYNNLYNLPPNPGYIVSGSQGIGMLDVNLNEIIPPIYANVSTILFHNYYLIGTQKKDGDFYSLADKIMDANWNSYSVPIEGSITTLTNLIPILGSEVPKGDPSESPGIRSISFIKLKNKAGTKSENKFIDDAIYFVVNTKDENAYSMLNRYCISIPNYKIEDIGETLMIKETISNDFLKFYGGEDNIIEFHFGGTSYKMAPQLFSDAELSNAAELLVAELFAAELLVAELFADGLLNDRAIESNYSKSWLDEFRGILKTF